MQFSPRRLLARAAQSLAVVAGLFALASLPASAATNWSPVQDALHADGVLEPSGVLRFELVRNDLSLTVAGMPVAPGEVANGYVNFLQLGTGDSYYVDGSLPAVEAEVPALELALRENYSISIASVVNHTANETPKMLWVHFEAIGPQAGLLKPLSDALATIKNPQIGVTTTLVNAMPYVPQQFSAIFQKGMIKNINGIYAFMLPRPDESAIHLGPVPAKPALGVAQTIFVAAPNGDATGLIFNAEFALHDNEIPQVADTLRKAGFIVPAQHNHFLGDYRRLFFLHAFGTGDTATLEQGLLNALQLIQQGQTK